MSSIFKALCGKLNENIHGLFRLSSVEPLASRWPAILAIALWLACAAVVMWQGMGR